MSLSSDTEGLPPGHQHSSLPQRTDPDIREEEGEGDPTPCMNFQTGPTHHPVDEEETEMDYAKSVVDAGGGDCTTRADDITSVSQEGAAQAGPKSQSAAGLNYDSVKYTLVVDEHAQLELVSLKHCFHSYNKHNDDSDAETVYQSANEEEDPEYEEERKRKEKAKNQGNNSFEF